MSEIDDIDKLNLKNFKNLKCFDFDGDYLDTRPQELYDGTVDDLEDINIISEDNIEYDENYTKQMSNENYTKHKITYKII